MRQKRIYKRLKLDDNIKGYTGYHVTREGVVYSRWKLNGIKGYCLTKNLWYIKPTQLLNPRGKKGYINRLGEDIRRPRVYLRSDNGKSKFLGIHRLVAEAYIPNPHNLPCVCHKDNNTQNNVVDNLYWGTYKDNMFQTLSDGRFVKHSNKVGDYNLLTIRQIARVVKLRIKGYPKIKLAIKFNTTVQRITRLLNSERSYQLYTDIYINKIHKEV